jgi:diguanylate cyclase (GGDEF)-like protein
MSVRTSPELAGTFVASTADALRPAALGLSVAYLVVALPPNLVAHSGSTRILMCATMVAGALVCVTVAWMARYPRRPRWLATPTLAAVLASVATTTSLVSLAVNDEAFQTVNLVLTLVGAAALIHLRATAVAVGVMVVGGWLLVCLLAAPRALSVDSATAMAMAVVLAVILHLAGRRNVARLEAARAEIQLMAATDDLTELSNRRALLMLGSPLAEAGHRAGRDITLLYIDVDGLKEVNDSQGHAAGDALIVAFARALARVFRTADMVARTGGDEFAVLLIGCGPPEMGMLRARLDAALAQIGASASCGAAHLLAGDPPTSLERLIDRADLAMYAEKRRHRQRTRGRMA